MADYIDREEVLKHKAVLYDPLNLCAPSYVVTIKSIMKIPSADVVPVVRCKDCGNGEDFAIGTERRRWCRLHHSAMQMDDFCSHGGKRKDDV